MEKLLICGLEAAKLLNVNNSQLKLMRETCGLPFVRYNKRCLYSPEALREWVRAQTKTYEAAVAK